ncbi:MAG: DUF2804 family protein [Alphaproteobacteria bacterium]|nr:DUF2804 family protein [Alphaproteobacteria bacterium]
MSSVQPLPPVPGTPFRALDFTAWQGAWEGGLHEVRWGYEKGWLRSQVRRALVRRRWFQVAMFTDEIAVAAWIRDEGTTGAARAFVTDLKTGEVLAHRDGRGRPLGDLAVGPFAAWGTDAFLRNGACDIGLKRPEGADAWSLAARFDGLALRAELSQRGAPPAATIIGEHRSRRPGLTTKWNLLPSTGEVTAGGRTFDLTGAVGAIAYTNGFFPPGARWLEVTGLGTLPDGRRVGLAMSDGARHGAVQEHVLWIDDGVYESPRARILVGGRVARDTWRLRSAHGDLELKFRPIASDVETATRLRGSSRTARVIGRFFGRVPLPDGGQLVLDGLPGIAEDHRPAHAR